MDELQKGLREFVIEVGSMKLLVEINNENTDEYFLFCKPIATDIKYFFMGKGQDNNWVILSRFTVSPLILILEDEISEKIVTVLREL